MRVTSLRKHYEVNNCAAQLDIYTGGAGGRLCASG